MQGAESDVAETAGIKNESIDRENAGQDAAWLRTITRRFADEAGTSPNHTSLGRVEKTPDSPTVRSLKAALLSGDREEARAAMKEFVGSRKTEAAREIALASLKSTVRASQPIRVGSSTSDGTQALFMKWANKRLDPAEVARIQAIDRLYRDTAAVVGLMARRRKSAT